ncbi:hypothetical protein [Latilactobacillus curvatus]
MTIGTPVKIKGYNVHAVVTKNTGDGVTIRDANGREYFCFESELVISTKELVKQ